MVMNCCNELFIKVAEFQGNTSFLVKIVEARETLLQKLLNKKNAVMKASENSEAVNTFPDGGIINSTQEDECPSQQKDVLAEVVNALQETEIDDHGKTEQWSEEEDVELAHR
ncbi:unnamed protein product [Ilex paraguariensis]|uniref:Uncharacterized protein n=2 Tax=Ilex paraguariensis TaxID=185542 RepID=A0ABC8TR80_9AQUA